jgi:hypothetical protein
VDKTVGNSTLSAPSADELAELHAELRKRPRVYAYEVAEALNCDEATVSRFLNGRAKSLPGRQGPNTFRETVKRIRARKQSAA